MRKWFCKNDLQINYDVKKDIVQISFKAIGSFGNLVLQAVSRFLETHKVQFVRHENSIKMNIPTRFYIGLDGSPYGAHMISRDQVEQDLQHLTNDEIHFLSKLRRGQIRLEKISEMLHKSGYFDSNETHRRYVNELFDFTVEKRTVKKQEKAE